MAVDKRNFLRINSDDSPLALPVGDTRSMVNCHVWPTYVKGVKGNTLIGEAVFTSTKSFTANCPNGTVGDPVTRTATGYSYSSQSDADAAALLKAEQEATADLVCTPGATPSVVINDVIVTGNTVTVNATATNTPSEIEYSIGGVFQSSNVFNNVANGDYTATARLVDDTPVLDTALFSVNPAIQDLFYTYYFSNSGSGNISVFGGLTIPGQVIIADTITVNLGLSGLVEGSPSSVPVTLISPQGFYDEVINAAQFDPQSDVSITLAEADPPENTIVIGTPNNTQYRLKYINQPF